jgi:hypothetical protein
MKSFTVTGIISVIMTVLIGNVFPEESQQAKIRESSKVAKDHNQENQVNYGTQKGNVLIDFSDYTGGSVYTWLESKGFCFTSETKDPGIIELSANEDALIVKARQPTRVFIFNDSVNLKEFSKVRIEWGIIQYPKDASYEKKNNNEALMVYIFFGDVRLSSGCLFVPDSPYFIGLFLSKKDKINKPYTGRCFEEGGRFVCLGNPESGETVISEFDLYRAFQTYFQAAVPAISGISLEVDTSSSGDGGNAGAFIKRIEFLSK